MMKKLLPAMIGVALVGGMTAASADVQVKGHIDTAVAWIDDEISSGGSSVSEDDVNLHCTTCSIGFKGSEDLGNGMNVIFFLDWQYDTNNRNTNITDRDQWLGLENGFGQVRVGTISTGYKSHGAMIDPLYRTIAQARDHGLQSGLHSGAGEEGQGRADNTIRWDSKDYSGLKLVAHYTLDSDESDLEDNNPFGVGASYENGGILVFADYLTNDGDGDANQNELTAWKLGGKYSMNAFSVFGQYEDIQDDSHGAANAAILLGGVDVDLIVPAGDLVDVDGEVWHIGGTYTMGSNTLYAAYGQGDYDVDVLTGAFTGASTTFELDTFTIGGVHSLSKSTSVYAAYNNKDGELESFDIEEDVFAVGMKHKF